MPHLQKYILLLLIAHLFFASSCVSKKKINYFQNQSSTDSTLVKNTTSNYTPVFQKDDFLSISVAAMDLESIKPFTIANGIIGSGTQSPTYNSGMAANNGYLIDGNGDIEFPIIGKMHLEGMNRMEATALIQTKLSEYISNPVVNIRIQNFKITVLGDVKSPGSFNIPNERITLIEALGIAGDLNITGVRKNVLVIRDVDGVKQEYRIDLTSKDAFHSPVYYLSQNDVVYVEPNRAKRNSSLISNTAGVFISLASLIITTVSIIIR